VEGDCCSEVGRVGTPQGELVHPFNAAYFTNYLPLGGEEKLIHCGVTGETPYPTGGNNEKSAKFSCTLERD